MMLNQRGDDKAEGEGKRKLDPVSGEVVFELLKHRQFSLWTKVQTGQPKPAQMLKQP